MINQALCDSWLAGVCVVMKVRVHLSSGREAGSELMTELSNNTAHSKALACSCHAHCNLPILQQTDS